MLLEHRNIQDAAAIGIPDEEWGEVIVAVVVLHDSESFLNQRLRTSQATPTFFSTPDKIVVLDELPYNETGKLLRRVIKADLIEEINMKAWTV